MRRAYKYPRYFLIQYKYSKSWNNELEMRSCVSESLVHPTMVSVIRRVQFIKQWFLFFREFISSSNGFCFQRVWYIEQQFLFFREISASSKCFYSLQSLVHTAMISVHQRVQYIQQWFLFIRQLSTYSNDFCSSDSLVIQQWFLFFRQLSTYSNGVCSSESLVHPAMVSVHQRAQYIHQ